MACCRQQGCPNNCLGSHAAQLHLTHGWRTRACCKQLGAALVFRPCVDNADPFRLTVLSHLVDKFALLRTEVPGSTLSVFASSGCPVVWSC